MSPLGTVNKYLSYEVVLISHGSIPCYWGRGRRYTDLRAIFKEDLRRQERVKKPKLKKVQYPSVNAEN